MVWSKISKADGKPRYIKRYNNFYVLTTSQDQNCVNSIPEGWEVITRPSGHLKLRTSR